MFATSQWWTFCLKGETRAFLYFRAWALIFFLCRWLFLSCYKIFFDEDVFFFQGLKFSSFFLQQIKIASGYKVVKKTHLYGSIQKILSLSVDSFSQKMLSYCLSTISSSGGCYVVKLSHYCCIRFHADIWVSSIHNGKQVKCNARKKAL